MSDKKNDPHHHGKEHDQTPVDEKPADCLETTVVKEHPAAVNAPEAEPLEDLKQKLDAQSDSYLRLMAEFDNFKKRTSRDYERLIECANEKLIAELIEVRENFERAVKAGDQCDSVKTLMEGMKLIFSKLDRVLANNGLEPFGRAGDRFDPQFHDALMKIPDEEVPEDHILEIFEKGYSLKKRVIKHARVVVSSGSKEATGASTKESKTEP
ncbi:MAG: nucleotide exchange factor GrpE [Chitinispirillaceae bacterium]|nr:nucleotide exchange factor GrpE [Chitinispirillaceae bacterium]